LRKRASVDKAEWSDTREEQYRKDCQNIVFKFGDTFDNVDGTVYITQNDVRIEIAKPNKTKSFWYETWLKLKDFYGV
jgi:hypothetical protein